MHVESFGPALAVGSDASVKGTGRGWVVAWAHTDGKHTLSGSLRLPLSYTLRQAILFGEVKAICEALTTHTPHGRVALATDSLDARELITGTLERRNIIFLYGGVAARDVVTPEIQNLLDAVTAMGDMFTLRRDPRSELVIAADWASFEARMDGHGVSRRKRAGRRRSRAQVKPVAA